MSVSLSCDFFFSNEIVLCLEKKTKELLGSHGCAQLKRCCNSHSYCGRWDGNFFDDTTNNYAISEQLIPPPSLWPCRNVKHASSLSWNTNSSYFFRLDFSVIISIRKIRKLFPRSYLPSLSGWLWTCEMSTSEKCLYANYSG